MKTEKPRVDIRYDTTFRSGDLYLLTTKYGGIDALYNKDTKHYTIANFDVDRSARREGIGKNLLDTSKIHARELGAEIIKAAIISRECLDAMSAIFGEDSIIIDQKGEYAPIGQDISDTPTSAMLWHELAE